LQTLCRLGIDIANQISDKMHMKQLQKLLKGIGLLGCLLIFMQIATAQKKPTQDPNRPDLSKPSIKKDASIPVQLKNNPKNTGSKTTRPSSSPKDVDTKTTKPSTSPKDVGNKEAQPIIDGNCIPPKYDKTMTSKQIRALSKAYEECMKMKMQRMKENKQAKQK